MVNATTAIGIVGMLATVLMIIAVLYLTFLAHQSDYGEVSETESAPESSVAESK